MAARKRLAMQAADGRTWVPIQNQHKKSLDMVEYTRHTPTPGNETQVEPWGSMVSLPTQTGPMLMGDPVSTKPVGGLLRKFASSGVYRHASHAYAHMHIHTHTPAHEHHIHTYIYACRHHTFTHKYTEVYMHMNTTHTCTQVCNTQSCVHLSTIHVSREDVAEWEPVFLCSTSTFASDWLCYFEISVLSFIASKFSL